MVLYMDLGQAPCGGRKPSMAIPWGRGDVFFTLYPCPALMRRRRPAGKIFDMAFDRVSGSSRQTPCQPDGSEFEGAHILAQSSLGARCLSGGTGTSTVRGVVDMEMVKCQMNPAQRETVEMLQSCSMVEILDMAFLDDGEGAVVFEGDGVDGPACGYIELDGKVTWIAGG